LVAEGDDVAEGDGLAVDRREDGGHVIGRDRLGGLRRRGLGVLGVDGRRKREAGDHSGRKVAAHVDLLFARPLVALREIRFGTRIRRRALTATVHPLTCLAGRKRRLPRHPRMLRRFDAGEQAPAS